jgi:hypothetical protein
MDDTEDEVQDTVVVPFRTIQGDKAETPPEAETAIPENDYVITTMNGQTYSENGFLIFTPHHAAIMRESGKGAIPVLVVPLLNVEAAFIDADDEVLD